MEEQFRIKQIAENSFRVQKKFIKTKSKGYLWWKKTTETEEWNTVDKYGRELYFIGLYNNMDCVEKYKTLESAKKWIEDIHKYPIYFYIKTEK